jgi:hypothetical protein
VSVDNSCLERLNHALGEFIAEHTVRIDPPAKRAEFRQTWVDPFDVQIGQWKVFAPSAIGPERAGSCCAPGNAQARIEEGEVEEKKRNLLTDHPDALESP